MHVTLSQVTGTVGSTLAVGFVVWLVTVPLRQRSVTGLIASVVVTGPLAVLGGIGWALLLGPRVQGPQAALVLAVVAVVVAAGESGVFATRAYRRFHRAQRALRASLDTLAHHGAPVSARPMLAELDVVRVDLEHVAATLLAQRDEQRARDTSFRSLVGWVSSDLRAPLTVLQAISDDADAGRASAGLRSEIDRLVGVVSDLADLAGAAPGRPYAGARPGVDGREAVLREVFDDVVHALRPLLRLRDVTATVSGETSATVGLVGPDQEDLGRLLLSAAVEAVRKAPRGATVRLDASLHADDDVLRVDVGPGPVGSVAVRFPLALPAVGAPPSSSAS